MPSTPEHGAKVIIGLVSPGEMGSAIGSVLVAAGHTVLVCLGDRSADTRARASTSGFGDAGDYAGMVSSADIILSIVPPGSAIDVARAVAARGPYVGTAADYVDCNAVAPSTAVEINGIVAKAGMRYVDACIIGPPPRHGRTRLYVCGTDAERVVHLGVAGLEIEPVGSEIGHAKALKLSYAAVTKGLTAVLAEALVYSRRSGVDGAFISEMSRSQPSLLQLADSWLPSMLPKARRWVGEMTEIATALRDESLPDRTFRGLSEVYEWVDVTTGQDNRGATTASDVIDRISAGRDRPTL